LISEKGMSSISDSVSLSSSGSDRSDWSWRDRSGQSGSESSGRSVEERRIPIETITETREDPPEEVAKSNWPSKTQYR